MDAAVRTVHLGRRFGEQVAVDDLNLEVASGAIFGLVGPDGAGKTTTLRMLVGILRPSAGEVHVLGRDLARSPESVKRDIGYVSQRSNLYPDLTVAENLRFYADLFLVRRRAYRERAEELLAFAGLTPFTKRFAGQLSGGMKQKLALCCALIHRPRALFLDEPTNGVDPVSRREFWRMLYRMSKEGVTVFLSTAYLDEAERCARVGLMHEGRLAACDTPPALKRLLHGQVIEVQSPRARQAAAALRAAAPQLSVGLYGTRLRVVAAEGEDPTRAIERVFRDAGWAFEGPRAADATLEDVFLSLLSPHTAATKDGAA